MRKQKIRFVKKIIIFLIILILIILITNKLYYKFVISKMLNEKKEINWEKYLNSLEEKNIRYAFFGDSHTFDDINPQYINNSFNFATAGENYIEIYYRLRNLIYKDKVKINNIILEIDLHSFSSLFTDSATMADESWYYKKFIPIKEYAEITNKPKFVLWIKSNYPFLGKGKLFFVNDEKREIYFGWLKNTENFSRLYNMTDATYTKVNKHFKNQERINPKALFYFEKTLQLAKKNDINIMFIKLPVSREYDTVTDLKNITKKDYYETIFNSINKNIEDYQVLDYYSLFFNNTNYFRDSDHLNYIGAKDLSQQIAQDLNVTHSIEIQNF